MHQGHALAVVVDGVPDRRPHQARGALHRHRLDADAAVLGEADLLDPHLVLQKLDDLQRAVRVGLPFDAGVDVLGVLAEDRHVGLGRVFQGRRHALEITHRAQQS